MDQGKRPHPDRAFHHPDRIRTPPFEWAFMSLVVAAILVGLPVGIGAVFHFVLPWIARSWGM